MSQEKIAFVGVGRMGANMARRLKDCGYTISAVYDVNRPAADALAAELGAASASTLAEVTAAADVIFTVVTNDAAMRTIFLAGGDSLLTAAAGKTFVNCATLSPGMHTEVEAAAEAAPPRWKAAWPAPSARRVRARSISWSAGGKRPSTRWSPSSNSCP